jgi:hypothetical protein
MEGMISHKASLNMFHFDKQQQQQQQQNSVVFSPQANYTD